MNAPGPFTFRGCDLTAECLPATEVLAHRHRPGAIPGNRTSLRPLLVSGQRLPRRSAMREGGLMRSFKRVTAWQASLSQAERQHAAESPKLSLLRAARRQPAIFRGRGRQVMHLPCKQVYMGALPIDSTSLRPLRVSGRRLPSVASAKEGLDLSCAATAGRPFHCGELD